MFRVLAVLALAVGFDLYMVNGKYTDAAVSMSHTILLRCAEACSIFAIS
jgi:hypothetical protein